ncbi:hypothetical protein BGX24_006980 [Mortierella sp. AD032]|nr:hypothetical protein BGX24_006980 [Mortierella sp. AD032]
MIGIKSALSLMCLLVGATTSTFAAPVVGSEADAVVDTQLTKRSFNPRQKWQSDELNCVQILNPSPGATYHPGYFVRLNYGAGECDATAAGPWTIHLYNNLDIQGGKVSYDFHEVIASGVDEYKTQYLWTIPSNQNTKTKNVKKANEYYVRIETNSQEGVKLVGNAGPFAIYPQDTNRGLRGLAQHATQPLDDLKRREDTVANSDNGDFLAEFALRPNRPTPVSEVIYNPPTPSIITAPTPTKALGAPVPPAATVAPAPATPPVSKDTAALNNAAAPEEVKDVTGSNVADINAPVGIDAAAHSDGSKVQVKDSDAPANDVDVNVDTQDKTVGAATSGVPSIITDIAPGASDAAPASVALVADPAGPNGVANIPAITEIPEPHNTAPADEIHPPITPIAHTSFIPSKGIVAGAVAGGAIGVGIVGASFFGQVGGVIGAVIGGVIGGVAVLLHFIGIPV